MRTARLGRNVWRAWAALDRIDPTFQIDLVALESAPEQLRSEIVAQGVVL